MQILTANISHRVSESHEPQPTSKSICMCAPVWPVCGIKLCKEKLRPTWEDSVNRPACVFSRRGKAKRECVEGVAAGQADKAVFLITSESLIHLSSSSEESSSLGTWQTSSPVASSESEQ